MLRCELVLTKTCSCFIWLNISLLGQIVREPGRFGVLSLLILPLSPRSVPKWNGSSVEDRWLLSTWSWLRIPPTGSAMFIARWGVNRRLPFDAVPFFSQCYFLHHWSCTIMKEDSHATLTAYKTQMQVIFTLPWLYTRQDSYADNSHAGIDYWRGTMRRCMTWCYCGGTARHCVAAGCFCRATTWCRGITGEGLLLLHMANWCTELEVSSFGHSKDISGDVKCWNRSQLWPHPFQGWLVIQRLKLDIYYRFCKLWSL